MQEETTGPAGGGLGHRLLGICWGQKKIPESKLLKTIWCQNQWVWSESGRIFDLSLINMSDLRERLIFLPPPSVGDVPSCGPRWAFSPAQADFQEPARVMDRSYSSPTPVEPRRNNALVLRPPPPPPSRNGWAPEGFDGWTLPKSALLNPIQRTFLWGCKQLKEPFPPRQS